MTAHATTPPPPTQPPPGGRRVMVPVAYDAPCARRALVLLAAFLLGCVVVAVVAALGLGTVWQDVYGWMHPQVIGTA